MWSYFPRRTEVITNSWQVRSFSYTENMVPGGIIAPFSSSLVFTFSQPFCWFLISESLSYKCPQDSVLSVLLFTGDTHSLGDFMQTVSLSRVYLEMDFQIWTSQIHTSSLNSRNAYLTWTFNRWLKLECLTENIKFNISKS